jgi:hypothetical protein
MKFRNQLYRFLPLSVVHSSLKHATLLLLAAAFAFAPWPASADLMSVDMQKLQSDVEFDRGLAVANNMQLSDADKKIFWPVYTNYLEGLEQYNRSYASVIQSYAFAVNTNSLTDDVAKQLTDQFLAAQEGEIALRKTYVANLAKVLPPKTVARALQLENKIRAIAWYGMASQVPLIKQ